MYRYIRTLLFLIASLLVFSSFGYVFFGYPGMFVGIAIFGLIDVLFYVYSERFMVSLYNAIPADPEKYKNTLGIVSSISEKIGVSVPKTYIMDTSMPNIMFFGIGKNRSSILITRGLVQICDEKELESMLACEISKLKQCDMQLSSLVSAISCFLSYIPERLWRNAWKGDLRSRILIVPFMILSPFVGVSMVMVHLFINKKCIYLSDEKGARITKRTHTTISALEKISNEINYRPLNCGSYATGHLFAVNPFNMSFLSMLYSVHPPISERISRLKKLSV